MSVFTPISIFDARTFVAPYRLGDIIDFQNIAAGVENSNFFVTTTEGRYVLTIFEKILRKDLDFYMGLMSHLHRNGVACAAPLATDTHRHPGVERQACGPGEAPFRQRYCASNAQGLPRCRYGARANARGRAILQFANVQLARTVMVV